MYRLILANQVYVNVQMFSFRYYFCIPSFVYLSFANRTGGGARLNCSPVDILQ